MCVTPTVLLQMTANARRTAGESSQVVLSLLYPLGDLMRPMTTRALSED